MYQVFLENAARRFFERATASMQRRLDRCFEQLRKDPRRHPNIKALSAKLKGHWRFRLGDYRIVYRIDDDQRIVFVLLIAHRRDSYE